LIHEADAGTLFLDEIVTLRESSQAKLLRFLQEREYRPLGSSKTCQADVRVISASNVDIEKAVREGTLRRDLYYRLNVVSIQLPSLRERRDDIPLLARHFLVQYAARLKKNLTDFSPEAMRRLVLHDWPGNVRELEHSVHRAVVLTDHATIEPGDVFLPELEAARDHKSFQGAKAEAISQFEIDFITKLLVAHQGNITRAAKAAKKNRRAFWELIRKHGIDANRFRSHNS
jgi:DNA-binding NtrC family response regulator